LVEVVVDIGCHFTHVGVNTQAVCPPGPSGHCAPVTVDTQVLPDREEVLSVGNGVDDDVVVVGLEVGDVLDEVAGMVDVNNVVGGGDCWLTVQSGVSRSSMDLSAFTWF